MTRLELGIAICATLVGCAAPLEPSPEPPQSEPAEEPPKRPSTPDCTDDFPGDNGCERACPPDRQCVREENCVTGDFCFRVVPGVR
jgi:hypothetical protein